MSTNLLARQILAMQESLCQMHAKLNILITHQSYSPPTRAHSHLSQSQPPIPKPKIDNHTTRHHMDDSSVRKAIYYPSKGRTPRQKGNWKEYGQAYREREGRIKSTWTKDVNAKSKIKYYLQRDKKVKKQMQKF